MNQRACASAESAAPPAASMGVWREALYPLLVVVVTGVAYGHLVGGYFWAEDFYYLYLMNDHRPLEFVLTPHGGHVQTFRNLVFGLFHLLFGVRAELYFAAVLLTHLVNALLLFVLLRRMTAREPLACFGALLWSTCALAEGSLGWFSVYGHVLVGTLLLWVLLRIERAAASNAPVSPLSSPVARRAWEPAAWYLALLLASLSFGTGIGIALVFPVVLALWLPGPANRRVRWAFWSLPVLTLGLYVLFHQLYFAVAQMRDPTMRGVPGLAVLYWWTIPMMTARLLLYSAGGLVTGPFLVAIDPAVANAAGVLLWAGIAVAGCARTASRRHALWAAVLLATGAYGMVAIGRAPLTVAAERSIAEAVTSARYHYVGSLCVAVAACLSLQAMARWINLPRRVGAVLLAGWIAVTVVGMRRHPYAVVYNVDARQQVQRLFFRVGKLAIESRDPERVYIDNGQFHAAGYVLQRRDFPGLAAAFIALYPLNRVGGKEVYFVEEDLEIVEAARRRPWTRTAGLLVTPEERPRFEAGK